MRSDPDLEKIEQRYNNGDFFAAYEVAASALCGRKDCPEIARMAVLGLANDDAIQRAGQSFINYGLHHIQTLDMLSLAGELAKDRASQFRATNGGHVPERPGVLRCRLLCRQGRSQP